MTSAAPAAAVHIERFLDWATDPKLAVLDTETTGLRGEIIEVGIVDAWGRTLFDERLKPSCPVEAGALAVHGISNADLEGCPTLADVWPRLRQILASHRFVIYNAGFDVPRLADSLDASVPQWFENADDLALYKRLAQEADCVMEAYAPIYGHWSDWHGSYRWAKLAHACAERRVDVSDLKPHGALDDARATLRLIQATAQLDPATLTWIGQECGV